MSSVATRPHTEEVEALVRTLFCRFDGDMSEVTKIWMQIEQEAHAAQSNCVDYSAMTLVVIAKQARGIRLNPFLKAGITTLQDIREYEFINYGNNLVCRKNGADVDLPMVGVSTIRKIRRALICQLGDKVVKKDFPFLYNI